MHNIRSIPKAAQAGFTLIEIMLALLVISVGIMAAIGLLGTALDTSAKSHDDLNMVSFADMVFNYCHAADRFDDITATGTLQIPDYDQGTASLQVGSLARFSAMAPGFGNTRKETYVVSYRLDVLPDANVKALSLLVWPGYDTNGSPRRFYTEIYNWSRN